MYSLYPVQCSACSTNGACVSLQAPVSPHRSVGPSVDQLVLDSQLVSPLVHHSVSQLVPGLLPEVPGLLPGVNSSTIPSWVMIAVEHYSGVQCGGV